MRTKRTMAAVMALCLGLVSSLAILTACGSTEANGMDSPSQPVVQPTVESPDRGPTSLEMRVGEMFTVSLDSNPTTGYRWVVGQGYDDGLLELVEDRFETDSKLVGAPGKQLLVFKAEAWGTNEFSLEYKRPWEDDVLESRRYIVDIGVSEALHSEMTQSEAREAAIAGVCGEEGTLKEGGFYNDWTGTWWIDMDVQMQGCSPACVVWPATGEVEVNYRCTGALPPQ